MLSLGDIDFVHLEVYHINTINTLVIGG